MMLITVRFFASTKTRPARLKSFAVSQNDKRISAVLLCKSDDSDPSVDNVTDAARKVLKKWMLDSNDDELNFDVGILGTDYKKDFIVFAKPLL